MKSKWTKSPNTGQHFRLYAERSQRLILFQIEGQVMEHETSAGSFGPHVSWYVQPCAIRGTIDITAEVPLAAAVKMAKKAADEAAEALAWEILRSLGECK